LAKGRRYSRKRKRYVILLGAMILLLAYPLYQWLSPPSAEEVMYATLRALQVGDVKTLILLTHPEEIRSLNLTPEAVDALLRTGVWRKGYLRPHGKPHAGASSPARHACVGCSNGTASQSQHPCLSGERRTLVPLAERDDSGGKRAGLSP
jgi:hypothetical protein